MHSPDRGEERAALRLRLSRGAGQPAEHAGGRHADKGLLVEAGVGSNFEPNVEIFHQYAALARNRAKESGVAAFLSNHVRRDGSDALMAKLADRSDADPHPFVSGDIGYELFDVFGNCALAQAARFEGPEHNKR